jgi:sodium/potassium-transporting ATPase subunit beta
MSSEEQTEAFLGKRHVAQKTGCAAFKEFLYNKEQKTCMGRTGMSWLEITIFYIIFYSCLAAFWAVSLGFFIYTLDDKLPRWYGKGSIVGINPGVGYQPWLSTDPDTTLIYFDPSDETTYSKYIDQMDLFMEKYANVNNTRKCNGKDSNNDETDQACRFDVSQFAADCSSSNNYGYDIGKPCVSLSLNRLIGWMPVAYPLDSVPASLVKDDAYVAGNVAMQCRGQNSADREHIGSDITYIPKSGLPEQFYPYRVMPNYHQPIAMVKFNNVARNVLVQIECLAYSYNIIHEPMDRMGLIRFELLIE